MSEIPESASYFFNEKPVMALIEIHRAGETYSTEVSNKIGTTYAHTVKLVSKLLSDGYIVKEKDGRKNILSTTEKGDRLAQSFQSVINELNGVEI